MIDMLDRYRAADAVLDLNVDPLVLNESVSPHWVDGSAFWYRRQTPGGGSEYVWVLADGTRRPAFDLKAAACSLSTLVCAPIDPDSIQVDSIGPDGSVVIHYDSRRYCINDGEAKEGGPVPQPIPGTLTSPDGGKLLFARGHDLWLRDAASGEETRLTDDGVENWSWGQYPDSGLLGVVRRRTGLKFAPFGWSWSPDGSWLVGGRVDERHVEEYPFLELVPQDGGVRPRVYSIRQPLVGEAGPKTEAWAIEVATGRRVRLATPNGVGVEPLGWSTDGRRVFTLAYSDGRREISLIEVEVNTGVARAIVIERPPGFAGSNAEMYHRPNVRLLANARQAIWWSERSGWGHLYRYDCASGKVLNAITSGEWLVRDILHIDEERQRLFFTGSGREGGNPYYRYVYRVSFDGSNLVRLTPDEADHTIDGPPIAMLSRLYGVPEPAPMVSPDGTVFIESHSTIGAPGSTSLRSCEDGREIATLEKADASALLAIGWVPPEPFVAKAADGVTDLYGVLYRPDAGSAIPAPIIDSIYAGPQVSVTPHNFRAGRRTMGGHGRSALSKLGFAVLAIDGRGTPLRSRDFHDAGFDNFADVALDDHVAVVKQLCDRDPTLDGNRVGIFGHSFGGYTSTRAVLRHPDVYKVAVSSAGSHSLHAMYAQVTEYLPAADYGEGSSVKPGIGAVPENYRQLDNAVYAANLTGKLLLAYGDMDENAYPAATLQLYDALIKANRSPDLLCMPNRMHSFNHEPYFVRRLWDYFVTHLLGKRPPLDYQIGSATGSGGLA